MLLDLQTKIVAPSLPNIFRAFKLTPFNTVKVVILGQDPYYSHGVADGLAFSSHHTIPPSLKNIFQEIQSDLSLTNPLNSGDLTHWAQQGVLLINSCLTVIENKPLSHNNIGWEQFSHNIINILSMNRKNIVFLLWGKKAQSYATSIANKQEHLILKAAHPSSLSAHKGFFGCKHFSKTNRYLGKHNMEIINW